ncbi:stigma-specific STIG1-like protein 4 [Zea mays]|uniref:Stigma-specific STIG1-like protein 4 n=1 Tax=Zea mays TaxID=4577 RepID=A0A1D6MEP2_MAIZE|nr:stigma-specific STIG1-like protein 4 [Zea mays]ONM28106.1 Stigma-specific STIG1-like protein 4 [Zea mays]|eukprot:XP_020406244.1 stigma-specific STIG1-like protein 4 [Zea mays]
MRKATIFLMALALTLIPHEQTVATPPQPLPLQLRRSRFLAANNVNFSPPPPPSFYDCSKKPPSICLSPGSPGATCCRGTCVDTEYSSQHCGNCNKMCKLAQACCQGNCVNTLTDEKNCGGCGVKCRTKCTNGYCDYAA